MKNATETGTNRTGMAKAPRRKEQQKENSWQPAMDAPGDPAEFARVHAGLGLETETVGSMPKPASLKEAAASTLQMLKGRNPNAFLDKLGERLAFERTGTRLFDLLLIKFEETGAVTGAASGETLRIFREEEAGHFRTLWECLETLGADPTVQTPCADLSGVKSAGLIQLMSDPRTTFAQALDALLIAELADNEGWRMLITMAEAMGQDRMAARFREALEEEDIHLKTIRQWWSDLTLMEADVEEVAAASPPSP